MEDKTGTGIDFSVLNPSISRKTFLTLSLLAFLTACGAPTTPTPSSTATKIATAVPTSDGMYHGIIPQLKGKELLPQSDLAAMIEALRGSGSPYLAMTGEHIATLTSVVSRPPEIPQIVTGEWPLPVAFDTTNRSTASSREVLDPANLFTFTAPGKAPQQISPIANIQIGIKLGIEPVLRSQGPLVMALYLAKEFNNHMINLRIITEYFKLITSQGINLTELNGTPITNHLRQIAVGAAIYSNQTSIPGSIFYNIGDIVPDLMIGTQIQQLINAGKLNTSGLATGPFFHARDVLSSNPKGAIYIQRLTDQWIGSGSLLPPIGTTPTIFGDQVVPLIEQLKRLIGSGEIKNYQPRA